MDAADDRGRAGKDRDFCRWDLSPVSSEFTPLGTKVRVEVAVEGPRVGGASSSTIVVAVDAGRRATSCCRCQLSGRS